MRKIINVLFKQTAMFDLTSPNPLLALASLVSFQNKALDYAWFAIMMVIGIVLITMIIIKWAPSRSKTNETN